MESRKILQTKLTAEKGWRHRLVDTAGEGEGGTD